MALVCERLGHTDEAAHHINLAVEHLEPGHPHRSRFCADQERLNKAAKATARLALREEV
jgi:hypothetical protein